MFFSLVFYYFWISFLVLSFLLFSFFFAHITIALLSVPPFFLCHWILWLEYSTNGLFVELMWLFWKEMLMFVLCVIFNTVLFGASFFFTMDVNYAQDLHYDDGK
eukprot:48430_1